MLNTVPGQAYTLTFELSGAGAVGSASLDLDILSLNEPLIPTASFTNPATPTTHTIQFVADSHEVLLRFSDTTSQSVQGFDIAVDNVSVTPDNPSLPRADTDDDGIENVFDIDSDGDGILDSIEGDGIINSLDTDSDNGGIDDVIEAQFGQTFIAPTGNDADDDGLDDAFDATPNSGAAGSIGLVPADTNSDGLADFLDDNGGSDALPSTSGDDTLTINGNGVAGLSSAPMSGVIADIDGDMGTDTLALTGSNITLDLTNIDNGRINSIENIDISGNGENTLTLDANDLLDLSDVTDELIVFGDSDDIINIEGSFTLDGTRDVDGENFDVYADGTATLIVDPDVTVTVVP